MMDLIDRTKYRKDLLYAYDDVSMEFDVLDNQPTVNVIPIPENATNGDVIMALFPQWNLREEIGFEYKLFGEEHKFEGLVDEDWWNAPYESGVN